MAAGFIRTQSGTLLLFVSAQLRTVVDWYVTPGFLMVKTLSLFAGSRYLLTLTRSDVLPLPNKSYAAPMRGVMSWKPVTPSDRGNVNGVARNSDGAKTPFSPSGYQLHACS